MLLCLEITAEFLMKVHFSVTKIKMRLMNGKVRG